ncbi:hypothetical protein NL868_001329 [Shigella flexneri]|nr:hypothetical protein [Shigella flexneri]
MAGKNTEKVYQFPYDTELDKDIHEWLKKLPRSRKAEMVRNAIRFYLQSKGISGNPIPVIPVEQTVKEIKKKGRKPVDRLKEIEE